LPGPLKYRADVTIEENMLPEIASLISKAINNIEKLDSKKNGSLGIALKVV
jgi:hypothetical protein